MWTIRFPTKPKQNRQVPAEHSERQNKLQVNSICPLQKAAENTHTHTHSSNPFRTKVLYKTALIIIIVIIIIIIKKQSTRLYMSATPKERKRVKGTAAVITP